MVIVISVLVKLIFFFFCVKWLELIFNFIFIIVVNIINCFINIVMKIRKLVLINNVMEYFYFGLWYIDRGREI